MKPTLRATLATPFLALTLASFAQAPVRDADLPGIVLRARTQKVAARPTPPKWMNYEQVAAGYKFLGAHRRTSERVMAMSSLAATFAAKDIAPVLMQTGRLPTAFQERMRDTGLWMAIILTPPKSEADFVKREYGQAVTLGHLHASVADMVRAPLKWNPKERVPMNAQSFAFVLYTFAWWPVEAMIATNEIDPVKDAKDIDAWFHLWSVIGYGMGAPENLLPRDFEQAKKTVELLKTAQYVTPGEKLPAGIPVLLGGHVRMVSGMVAPRDKAATPEARQAAAKALADIFTLSPGLNEALGLKDPVAQLVAYGNQPAPKPK